MKNIRFFCFITLLVIVFYACNKDSLPGHQLHLVLTETGSGLPAANVKVVIANVDTFTNTGPDLTYFNDYTYTVEDTLGTTDDSGNLIYHLPKDFTAVGKVLFALENDQFWESKISLIDFQPDDVLTSELFPFGYITVKVNHLQTSDEPADIFALMQMDETYYWMKEYITPYGTALLGDSVELTGKVRGNFSNVIFVEQHYNFLSSAHALKTLDPVFVPARDTVFLEVDF
jgi:hypothetical protein